MSADSERQVPHGGTPGELLLTVAAVARRLGVAPATLRTWDRRYGLGPSAHVSGTHRRYTPTDVHRLQAVRRLTLAGMPAADAARAVIGLPDDDPAVTGSDAPAPPAVHPPPVAPPPPPTPGAAPTPGAPPPPSALPGPVAPPVHPAPPAPRPPPASPAPPGSVAGDRAAGGGARAGAGPPDADLQQRGLARAATALDQAAVAEMLWRSLRRSGVVPTWELLLRPVLVAVGRRWELTGEGVEVEHLLAHTTDAVLRSYAVAAPEPPSGRPVLLAAVPGELHGLPLAALAAALAERGVGSRVLGTDMPVAGFVAAVRRTGPSAVLLWSQLPSPAGLDLLAAMPVLRPPTAVITGGRGWPVEELPTGVAHAPGLAEAVDLVLGATAHGPGGSPDRS